MTLSEDLQAALGSAYAVERELGGGGMSRLFVAEEIALGRRVAVKVLAPELAAGVSADRFQREIKLAAQLQHPNIVPVHATGVAAGLPYYTMPFVDGLSLRARLERNRGVPISEAVGILKDVARALAYAHDHGVVHRDIKPENILLADEASVVTDFGIAKALHAAKTDAPGGTLTQVGTSVGTPAYMAPEQVAGDPATDHRADIYSFGCVAYELLTGAAPFAHRQPHQLFAAHMGERPAPLSDRRADCPPALADLVMRCMEKEPASRPQSARDILHALEAARSQEVASPSAASKPGRSGRKLVIGAIGGIAIFAAIAAIAFRTTNGGQSIQSLAVLPFENVGGDSANAYFADGMADELTTELTKIQGLTLASRTSAFRYRGKTVDVKQIGRELDVGAIIEGSVRRSGNRLRLTTQLTDASSGRIIWTDSYEQEVEDLFAVQDSITGAIVSALRLKLAGAPSGSSTATASRGTDNLEAYDLYLRGRHLWQRRGDASLRQAMRLFEQAIALDPGFARAHAGLAMTTSVLPMYAAIRSDSVYPVGISAGRRAIELDPDLADGHAGLANNLIYEFKWDEAEGHLKRALALEPNNATAHQWYGDFLYVTGRLDESIVELQKAADLDPYSPVMRNDLGVILGLAGRGAEGLREMERAVELDSVFTWARGNLAIALAREGHQDSASKLLAGGGDFAPYARLLILLGANRLDEAAKLGRGFLMASRPEAFNSEMFIIGHAAGRNADSTIYWLNRAIDLRDGFLFAQSIPCHKLFEFVQDDPRFLASLARMKVGRCRRS